MRIGRTLGGAALLLLALSAGRPALGQEGAGRLHYVQAGPSGARARNLYDAQGLVVRDLPAGTLLAVHGERAGWLDVEAPGGFKVWVYGKYVRPADEAGRVKITGSNVRMRPLPSSGPESLPLTQKFAVGDEVRLIGRDDSTRSLDEDWVQVWSPPGARAWVRAAETEPLAAGADGPRLWADAVARASAAPGSATQSLGAPRGTPAEAAAPAAPRTQEAARANDLLFQADQILDGERRREELGGQPDYAVATRAYEEVLAVTATGPTADLARGRIQLAKSYADAYQIRIDLETQKNQYQQQLRQREEDRLAARERDVFEGRFAERGWLERRPAPAEDAEPIWVLHYAGGDAARLVCSSGRYDLGLFSDFEIGVNGATLSGANLATGLPRPRTIDVTSIEVISGRRRK